ncbi:hypothetical protein KUA25_18640, partial [Bacteroidales bacterium MSK.15.36]|nr:hypothetical protein [Bacteroidales bacterium MSK.15.36]
KPVVDFHHQVVDHAGHTNKRELLSKSSCFIKKFNISPVYELDKQALSFPPKECFQLRQVS